MPCRKGRSGMDVWRGVLGGATDGRRGESGVLGSKLGDKGGRRVMVETWGGEEPRVFERMVGIWGLTLKCQESLGPGEKRCFALQSLLFSARSALNALS